MFCVIQEIPTRKPSTGTPKRIEAYKSEWSMNGIKQCRYGWRYSDERFERPLKPSYRISIHQSYREDGKVKKSNLSYVLHDTMISRKIFSVYMMNGIQKR